MDFAKLKVVFFDSTEINLDNIVWGLLELNVQVENPPLMVQTEVYEEKDVEDILSYLTACDVVMTQNFCTSVAEAAHRKNLPYITWVYDSPQRALYLKEAKYPTNYIFSFDHIQVERIKRVGVQNIFYCPMAANVHRAAMINPDEGILDEYRGQISFVGKLYNSKLVDRILQEPSGMLPKKLEEFSHRHGMIWDGSSIYGKMDDELFAMISLVVDRGFLQSFAMDYRYGCETFVVVPYLTHFERACVLTELSKDYNVQLFTDNPDRVLNVGNTHVHGHVEYSSEAFKVFCHSKINLNLTMRGIESGVPLRVFDIMSIGGFVMSNYQPEAEILFEPDKEIVLFHDMDELREKAEFYLTHERDRLEIALNGFKKVRDCYSYPRLLSYILNSVFG